MLQAKRNKFVTDDDAGRLRALEDELQVIQAEVEPIEVKRSSTGRHESVTYRPTYRAVLAKNGYFDLSMSNFRSWCIKTSEAASTCRVYGQIL